MSDLKKRLIKLSTGKNEKGESKTIEGYWESREKKLEAQMQIAETDIFKNCIFYILGFVGRGEESRLRMAKEIEKNGGKTTMMITSHTTHVISRAICHSKRKMMDKWIEKRSVLVVAPEYVKDCIREQKLLEPDPYITVKQKNPTIDTFFGKCK